MATSTGWWMYHGDPAHTGYVGSGSTIDAAALTAAIRHPAHTQCRRADLVGAGGDRRIIYVGVANSNAVIGDLGGTLLKVELASGTISANKYTWPIAANERDAHGFCGMGCTTSVVDARLISSGSTPSSTASMPPTSRPSGSRTCATATPIKISLYKHSIRMTQIRRLPAGRRRWWSTAAFTSASVRAEFQPQQLCILP